MERGDGMEMLSRIFGRSTPSADVAKKRLQLVLVQDRTSISPETLNVLKDEIIAVIAQHVEIDRENVQVSIAQNTAGHQLVAYIPVRNPRHERAAAKGEEAVRHAKKA